MPGRRPARLGGRERAARPGAPVGAVTALADGNGRLRRLLVVLLLVEWGLLPGPVVDLSAYIEPRRDRYYAALLAVSTKGDWPTWWEFILEVFEAQARDAIGRVRRPENLRTEYRGRVITPRFGPAPRPGQRTFPHPCPDDPPRPGNPGRHPPRRHAHRGAACPRRDPP